MTASPVTPARSAGGIDATMAAMETAANRSPTREWRLFDRGSIRAVQLSRPYQMWPSTKAVVNWPGFDGCYFSKRDDGRHAAHIAASCPANVLAVLDHARSETTRADAERQAREAAERERDEAREDMHFANGTADLEIKDRRIAEAALAAERTRADALQAKVEVLVGALRNMKASPFSPEMDEALRLLADHDR